MDNTLNYCPQCKCESCAAADMSCPNCPHCNADNDHSGDYEPADNSPTTPPTTPRRANVLPTLPKVETTLKARSITSSIPSVKKARAARKAAAVAHESFPPVPDGTAVCVLTLRWHPVVGVNGCHVVRKADGMDGEKATECEFWWGLGYKTFNVDTPNNIVTITSELQYAFDHDFWALLPTDSNASTTLLLDANGLEEHGESWYDDYRRKVNAIGRDGPIKYVFLPLSSSFCFPILRLQPPWDAEPLEFTVHDYPYKKFPELELHILPQYVIWNLGKKFEELKLNESYLDINGEFGHLNKYHLNKYKPALLAALQAYRSWKATPVPGWFTENGKSQQPAPSESDSGTDRSGRKTPSSTHSAANLQEGPHPGEGGGNTTHEECNDTLGPDDSASLNGQTPPRSSCGSENEPIADFEEDKETFSSRIASWRNEVTPTNEED